MRIGSRAEVAATMLLVSAAAHAAGLVVEHAAVVPMNSQRVLRDYSVWVDEGSIVAVEPTSRLTLAPDIQRIDGRGKYLIPGLCDMHVHIDATESLSDEAVRDELLLYVANGVTTVRNMSGSAFHLVLRARVERGDLLGPRLFTTGPILETVRSHAALVEPTFKKVATPAEAVTEVRAEKSAGYDFIKVYNQITPEVYAAIVRTAQEQDIPFVGHVPIEPGLEAAFANHEASIEHLRGYDLELSPDPRSTRPEIRFAGWTKATDAQLDSLVTRTLAAAVWNVPTLLSVATQDDSPLTRSLSVDYPYLPAFMFESMYDNYLHAIFSPAVLKLMADGLPSQRRLVRKLIERGAPVMAGTDAMAPGIGLHAEVRLIAGSGVSAVQALQTATAAAGAWLERYTHSPQRLGTIEAGKAADLVLLDGNPLEDLAALDHISGVMLRGRWLDRQELDRRLEDLRSRNAPQIAEIRARISAERR